MRLHALATVIAVALGVFLQLPVWKWCCVIFCTGLVWMAELFNTALEVLCDRVSPEQDDAIRRVKDVAAGAVLIAAIMAAGIGALILLPDLIALFA